MVRAALTLLQFTVALLLLLVIVSKMISVRHVSREGTVWSRIGPHWCYMCTVTITSKSYAWIELLELHLLQGPKVGSV